MPRSFPSTRLSGAILWKTRSCASPSPRPELGTTSSLGRSTSLSSVVRSTLSESLMIAISSPSCRNVRSCRRLLVMTPCTGPSAWNLDCTPQASLAALPSSFYHECSKDGHIYLSTTSTLQPSIASNRRRGAMPLRTFTSSTTAASSTWNGSQAIATN